ncbi:hypothetical protein ACQKWADRAFT_16632 [Trichoderma austrokoningii]
MTRNTRAGAHNKNKKKSQAQRAPLQFSTASLVFFFFFCFCPVFSNFVRGSHAYKLVPFLVGLYIPTSHGPRHAAGSPIGILLTRYRCSFCVSLAQERRSKRLSCQSRVVFASFFFSSVCWRRSHTMLPSQVSNGRCCSYQMLVGSAKGQEKAKRKIKAALGCFFPSGQPTFEAFLARRRRRAGFLDVLPRRCQDSSRFAVTAREHACSTSPG